MLCTLVTGTDSRKLHSLDPRPCTECGRVYSNLSNLRQHMKLIHYPTYVECPICKKSFKTDLYLRRHTMSCHESHSRGSDIHFRNLRNTDDSSYGVSVAPARKSIPTRNFSSTKHMSSCLASKYELRNGSNY